MKLSVVGCGYLGAVHAAAMASLGHHVVGIDVDSDKVGALNLAQAPFFEPELPELLSAGRGSGRLRFSTDYAEARDATVHFIGVGTPQRAGSDAADLTYVFAAVNSLIPYLKVGDVVVGKSTVPVGTAAELSSLVAQSGATLVWNPEFLREGFAIQDTINPDRIVVGTQDTAEGSRALDILSAVYEQALAQGTPLVTTDLQTAELVKVSANAFLATKISFINAISQIADATGADVTKLADAIGLDDRIGRKFLNAGVGFGGGCLPKDIRAFRARAEELGLGESVHFLAEVDKINLDMRSRTVELVEHVVGGNVAGHRIAVLGAAFKPNSDDVRDSPALDVAVQLHERGAIVNVTDPEATTPGSRRYPELAFTANLSDAVRNADVVVLLTEWKQYKELTPAGLEALTTARTIIDGRNCLTPHEWTSAGWHYRGIGRR